jgi:hypothetical protein
MNIAVPSPTRLIDDNRARLDFVVAKEAEAAMARLGRTEDLRFSPDGRRMAIAGFAKGTCLVLDVEIVRSGPRPILHITDYMELHSPALKEPHGFDFVDDRTLVVANRTGGVTIFGVPQHVGTQRIQSLMPLRTITRAGVRKRLNSPGSVCVAGVKNGRCELLVCNNYKHRITRHVIRLDGGWSLPRNSILLEQGLEVPDGIAMSPDKAWIAVSNHMTNSVLVFDNTARLNRQSSHVGTLLGVSYPHGLRFSPGGQRIYVADAGTPYVHIYEAGPDGWAGEHEPVVSFRVLDDETFHKGRHNPEEGGSKGLDIDASGELLVVTNEEQPLACFHIPALLS